MCRNLLFQMSVHIFLKMSNVPKKSSNLSTAAACCNHTIQNNIENPDDVLEIICHSETLNLRGAPSPTKMVFFVNSPHVSGICDSTLFSWSFLHAFPPCVTRGYWPNKWDAIISGRHFNETWRSPPNRGGETNLLIEGKLWKIWGQVMPSLIASWYISTSWFKHLANKWTATWFPHLENIFVHRLLGSDFTWIAFSSGLFHIPPASMALEVSTDVAHCAFMSLTALPPGSLTVRPWK